MRLISDRLLATLPLSPEESARLAGWQRAGAQCLQVAISTPLASPALAVTAGEVYYRDWSPTERHRRSLRWLALLWLLAVAFLVVPLVHFVLPPLLAVAGPLVAIKIAGLQRSVFGGVGVCPKCAQAVWIGAVPLLFPLAETCGRCYTAVAIAPAANEHR